MADTRQKNANWNLVVNPDGRSFDNGQAQLAVLMDIRDELQRLNNLLHCHNAVAIPDLLRHIKKNTSKRKYRKKVVL